jgi:uncharacterized membrane protein
MTFGEMSEEQFQAAPPNTGVKSLPTSQADGDMSAMDGEIVVEKVKERLVTSGVRKEQAPILAEQVINIAASYHRGPLPPASEFAEYENACNGAARDILDMAKSRQAHVQFVEKVHAVGELILQLATIVSAVVLVLGMIAGSIYASIYADKALGYEIAAGSGIALVIGPLIRSVFKSGEKVKQPPQQKTPRKKGR